MKKNKVNNPILQFPVYRILFGIIFYLFILAFINTSTHTQTLIKPNPISQNFVSIQDKSFTLQGQQFIPKGINHFDMYSLWDPSITDPSYDWITADDFKYFKNAGFNSIRIAVKTDYFINPENGKIKESGFNWLDYICELAESNNLRLIIDMHMPTGGVQQDYNINDANQLFWNNQQNLSYFVDAWREIAKRNSNNSTIWAYDVMNEPATWDLDKYNNLIYQTVASIRSEDTNHIIIIQPGLQLQDGEVHLIFPDVYDAKIAHSLHFYEPHAFTHQNVSWGISGDQAIIDYPTATSSDQTWNKEKVTQTFTQAAYNAGLDNFPVVLTEFGTVFHKLYTGQDIWINDIISAANHLQTGWHYWYYKGPEYNDQMGITIQTGINRPIIWKVLKQQAQNPHE